MDLVTDRHSLTIDFYLLVDKLCIQSSRKLERNGILRLDEKTGD